MEKNVYDIIITDSKTGEILNKTENVVPVESLDELESDTERRKVTIKFFKVLKSKDILSFDFNGDMNFQEVENEDGEIDINIQIDDEDFIDKLIENLQILKNNN